MNSLDLHEFAIFSAYPREDVPRRFPPQKRGPEGAHLHSRVEGASPAVVFGRFFVFALKCQDLNWLYGLRIIPVCFRG